MFLTLQLKQSLWKVLWPITISNVIPNFRPHGLGISPITNVQPFLLWFWMGALQSCCFKLYHQYLIIISLECFINLWLSQWDSCTLRLHFSLCLLCYPVWFLVFRVLNILTVILNSTTLMLNPGAINMWVGVADFCYKLTFLFLVFCFQDVCLSDEVHYSLI